MKGNNIPIVFSTDHNFVMPTCVTIHSLLTTADQDTHFDIIVLINPDVTQGDKEILEKQVRLDSDGTKIRFIEIGDSFKNSFEIRDVSIATYSRLLIPWLLPEYDKVIYSDVDIIFKGDISEVYEIDMTGKLVAGYGGEAWKRGLIKKYLLKIGADPESYINAGFIVINSKLQREKDLEKKYLSLSKKKFLYQDQDIINLVCRGHVRLIPEIYNTKPKEVYNYSHGEVKVIHYTGLKPWDYFTYSWCDWWECYKGCCMYNPIRNKNVSSKVLKWNNELLRKRKLIIQKLGFIKEFLLYK